MRLGIWEILLIIVLVLILFGGKKLAGVGKSLGRGIREFKEEVHADDENTEEKKDAETAEPSGEAKEKEGDSDGR